MRILDSVVDRGLIAAADRSGVYVLEWKESMCTRWNVHFDAESAPCCTANLFVSSTPLRDIYIACITDDKCAWTYKLSRERNAFDRILKCRFAKRLSSIQIVNDGSSVVIADKVGDVYHLILDEQNTFDGKLSNIEDDESETVKTSSNVIKASNVLLMGHFSCLTDARVHNVGNAGSMIIASADRDNKARISRFPDSDIIESFCLGHSEFVSCLCFVSSDGFLLATGSGDGTIRLWETLTGKQLSVFDESEDEKPALTWNLVCDQARDIVYCLVHNRPCLLAFHEVAASKSLKKRYSFDLGRVPRSIALLDSTTVLISFSGQEPCTRVLRVATRAGELSFVDCSDEFSYLSDVLKPRNDETKDFEDREVFDTEKSLIQMYKREMSETWRGKKKRPHFH